MHFKSSFPILSTVLLLLLTKGCHSELMCYVCDHCTTVGANTPLLACDESFFNGGGTELPSTMTTTTSTTMKEDPSTTVTTVTASTTDSTTVSTNVSTTEMTTTESSTTDSTVETTEDPTTTQSTARLPPTPPTQVPVETTTSLPTPPTQGTVMPVVEIVTQGTTGLAMNETVANSTARNYMNSTTFRVRQQRRSVESQADAVTYHCYSVRFTANLTVNTQRGCSRVTTNEAVCKQLESGAPNGSTVSKCQFCGTNRCNSSSTFGVSIFAVIIGLVASLIKRS